LFRLRFPTLHIVNATPAERALLEREDIERLTAGEP